ncbi:MAG TPA: hypothetical protein VJC09_02175 [Candidatus Saccharimonadales bacterium]|nr:hypothetical protein [Candidatus Saccharimonadales bacterium]
MSFSQGQPATSELNDPGQLVLETVEALRIPKTDYFLIGSGNLALRGLIDRDIADVYLLADSALVKAIARRSGAWITEGYDDKVKNTTAHLEQPYLPLPVSATVRLGWPHYPLDFYRHCGNTDEVWGIPCLDLGLVMASKRALGRDQDVEDGFAVNRAIGEMATVQERQ